IVVTGRHVNKGYLDPAHDPSTKLPLDGAVWHRTGDAGRLDDQGRLWLLGRTEARVHGLHPFGVENAARFWPGVRPAAVIGIRDRAVLAIEGEGDRLGLWQSKASGIGNMRVVHLPKIPLDKRHRSKVDYRALADAIGKRS